MEEEYLAHNKAFGDRGEEIAVEFLLKDGYNILHKNWRFGRLEMDIVAEKDSLVIFVEVKTRKNELFGLPEDSVDHLKEKKIAKLAAKYMEEFQIEKEVRFDIISIILKTDYIKIKQIKDAFFPFETF